MKAMEDQSLNRPMVFSPTQMQISTVKGLHSVSEEKRRIGPVMAGRNLNRAMEVVGINPRRISPGMLMNMASRGPRDGSPVTIDLVISRRKSLRGLRGPVTISRIRKKATSALNMAMTMRNRGMDTTTIITNITMRSDASTPTFFKFKTSTLRVLLISIYKLLNKITLHYVSLHCTI